MSRLTVALENGKSVAFGTDRHLGWWLDVYNEDDEPVLEVYGKGKVIDTLVANGVDQDLVTCVAMDLDPVEYLKRCGQ